MKRRIIYLAVALLAGSCNQQESSENHVKKLTRVKVVKARVLDYKSPVRATGMLGTSSQMKLSFKTGGIIEHISAKEGISVKKGSVLAQLNLAEIKAQVQQAKIGEEKSKRDLERARNLYHDSVATLEQYQDAQSGYEMARTRRQIADFNLQHSTIIAPSDGKVQKVLVEKNELIAPGYPAIFFASTESEWIVRASVSDKDIVKLNIGDTARIEMDAFPDKVFTGEISELASVADPVTGTYEVEMMIPGKHLQFRTGFISRVKIFPALTQRALVVPVGILVNASDRQATVYIYINGKAVSRKIRIGQLLGEEVVVLEGLVGDEMLISDGTHYLRDGEEVELVEDES